MPVLANSKHERFAQAIAKGGNLVESFISVGYAKASAHSNATRLMGNDGILKRIEELKTVIAAGVIDLEIRKRSNRVAVLQDKLNRMCALIDARAEMYGGQMGEDRRWRVYDAVEEKKARAEGFDELAYPDGHPTPPEPAAAPEAGAPPAAPPVPKPDYPKVMYHPGYPNGGATGMLVKDYRGKNAEQEIWKFDAALVQTINDTLKQAAIEEGQWTEKRALSGNVGISVIKARLNAGRDRIAAEARAAAAAAKIIQ